MMVHITPSVIKAQNVLRKAIEANPDASVAIIAPTSISDAFRVYVEAVRADAISIENLQTHMEDEIRRLDDEAKA